MVGFPTFGIPLRIGSEQIPYNNELQFLVEDGSNESADRFYSNREENLFSIIELSDLHSSNKDYFDSLELIPSNFLDGSYSFSFDSSAHSRSEVGDADNNVDGSFSFTNDGDQHQATYEAGSDTGFIVKADHIPIGPEVPGASSGQPTGDLEKVEEIGFDDPLAGSKMDRSYGFEFESDGYSRSESSDADGNVVGTYTVVDDDGLAITYQFRAGKGIGFETTEISRKQGPKPVRPTPYSGPLAIEEAAPFDVPGTPSFPTPGQSNYIHSHSFIRPGRSNYFSSLLKPVSSNLLPTISTSLSSNFGVPLPKHSINDLKSYFIE